MFFTNLLFIALILCIIYVSYQLGKAESETNLIQYQNVAYGQSIMWLAKNGFLAYDIDDNGQMNIIPIEDIINASQTNDSSEEET